MTIKSTYEDLEQRIKSLEKETAELKKADETLRESEERYRILLDAADHAGHAIILDQDIKGKKGACVFSNETAAKITGYSREELSNLSWFDIIHPQDRDASLERHRKRMNGAVIQDLFELSIIRKDGKKIPIEVSSTLSEYQGARALITFFKDITVRKRVEDTLRMSEEKYRELIENAVVGVYQVTDKGKYLMANRKLASTFGYGSPGEFLEAVVHVSRLYASPEQRDEILKEINSRGFIERKEVAFKRKDGSPFWIELNTRIITNDDGRTVYEGTAEDVTERKKAEEMLKQTNEELEQRVENRTIELRLSNEQLETQKKNLEEVNTALRVLLKKRDEDKSKMEQKVMFNMNELILPYMEKLNSSDLDERQKVLLDILESNLDDITSPFSQSLSHNYTGFTPSEMQIANLIKQGKTSKQIADLLILSSRTIETHRKNIRKKLGLGNKKRNLRTHLMSIQ